MLEQFLNHINRFRLFESSDKILLAVSGGVDSMVMLHLFKQANFSVAVAHCNFQLRGEESQGDEALVNTVCAGQGVPFFVKRFDTEKQAKENGISIEMAARELRYKFFEDVLEKEGYHYVATAHHLNDSFETTLLNLVRGTGVEGIGGIAVKNDKIIRPLLFASRKEIEDHAKTHQLQWREDSSNTSDKHQRNVLRNTIIPELKKINPGLDKGYGDTAERLRGGVSLVRFALDEIKKNVFCQEADKILIDVNKLKQYDFPEVVLWELVKAFGFNYDQCKEMLLQEHQSGKAFYSNTHQFTVDRLEWILTPETGKLNFDILIEKEEGRVDHGGRVLECRVIDNANFVLDKSPSIAQLDRDKVRFPIRWRNWKPGDHFVPLGMNHPKKISDFLVDGKVSLPDKANITVIESAGEIIWVAGHRISDPYKVTADTKRVIVFKLC